MYNYWTYLYLDGKFNWIDGKEVTFTFWKPGEPNGQDNDNDCVFGFVLGLAFNQLWQDGACTNSNGYSAVCKMPKSEKFHSILFFLFWFINGEIRLFLPY